MARILFIATLLSYCSLCLALPFDSTYEDEVATHKPTLPIPSAPDYVVEALARSETAAAASKVLPVFWENVQPPTPTYRMTNSFTVPRPTCGGNSFGELLCFIVTYASIAAVCVLALMPFFILAYTIFHQVKQVISTSKGDVENPRPRAWWSPWSEHYDEEPTVETKPILCVVEGDYGQSLKANY